MFGNFPKELVSGTLMSKLFEGTSCVVFVLPRNDQRTPEPFQILQRRSKMLKPALVKILDLDPEMFA